MKINDAINFDKKEFNKSLFLIKSWEALDENPDNLCFLQNIIVELEQYPDLNRDEIIETYWLLEKEGFLNAVTINDGFELTASGIAKAKGIKI
jgi:hypothetical protein